MKITHSQLADMIRGYDSSVIATFTAETIPGMVKKDRETGKPNPFYGRVTKLSRNNGVIGDFDWSNVVTNQLLREADETDTVESYESEERGWGTHIPDSGLVEHKDKLYIRISDPRCLESQFKVDGRPATKEEVKEIKRYLDIVKPYMGHGTKKEKRYRDYTLTNVKELRAGGMIYTVVSDNEEVNAA